MTCSLLKFPHNIYLIDTLLRYYIWPEIIEINRYTPIRIVPLVPPKRSRRLATLMEFYRIIEKRRSMMRIWIVPSTRIAEETTETIILLTSRRALILLLKNCSTSFLVTLSVWKVKKNILKKVVSLVMFLISAHVLCVRRLSLNIN